MVVLKITAGISCQSSESKAKTKAVAFKVIPRFTRLYSSAPRKVNETTSAIIGSTNPNYDMLPFSKLDLKNRNNAPTLLIFTWRLLGVHEQEAMREFVSDLSSPLLYEWWLTAPANFD